MKSKPKSIPKTLHIFKPGRHRPMQGGSLTFSEADLRACAAAYDADVHEAPIVIGHPETDAPAHGWIAALKADKRGLWAIPRQISAAFAEKVQQGAFKKISAAFYPPDGPDNPHPGRWTLRHVGFLGAQVPAVKGLARVTFAEHTGIVTFEEPIDLDGEVSGTGLFAQLRAWLLKHRGEEVADDVLPADKLKQLEDQVDDTADVQPDEPEIAPEDSAETVVEELVQQVAEQVEVIAQLTEAKEALEEQLESGEGAATAGAAAEFAERLVREGRLMPRHRAAVVAFMELAGGRKPRRSAAGVVSFGEGTHQRPLLPAFKAFLASLPQAAQFSEVADKRRAAASRPAVNPLIADAQRRHVRA